LLTGSMIRASASWFNHRRPYEHCGDIPPAELKEAYYSHTTGLAETG
jgi:hypothetical protein